MASIDSRRAKCCMSNAMGWLSSRPQPEPEREPELEPIDGREILIVCLNHKQRRSRKKEKEKQKKQKRGIQIKTSQDKNPAVGSPRPVGIRSRSSSSSSKWEDYAGYFLVVQSTVNHQLWGLASRHVTLSLSLSLLTLTSHTLHRHFAATQH